MSIGKKNWAAGIAIGLCLALGLAGCGQTKTTAPTTNTQAEDAALDADTKAKNVVLDAEQNKVQVPEKLTKVAVTCYGGTTHELCVLGASDLIVAQPTMKKFPQLLKMYPRFAQVVDPGSFDNVNVEEMIAADPDLVLVGLSSKQGNQKIREVGYDTYTMLIGWADIETLKQEFLNVGQLVGKQERAEKLVQYWDEKIEMVSKAIDKVPEGEKKVVYYTGKSITDANSSGWTWPLIETSGGISALPKEHKGEVNVEEVLGWNPDVIITQEGNGTEALLNDSRITQLKAIQNKAVYECPIAGFWWDRPSPESPLGFMWLAKTLYPEYTAEIDLQAETKYFFREFYDYELSDEEYQSFLKTGA